MSLKIPSRSLVRAALCAAVLFGAGTASAQFANHSIGFELGYVGVSNPVAQNFGSGLDLGLDSTLYIEGGFDIYFRLIVGIHNQYLPEKRVVGLFPAIGVRYLFSEDTVRPLVGLNFAYMHMFMDEYTARFSLSPYAGCEFFVAENTSLGIQGEYHPILALNDPIEHAFALISRIAWSF